MSNIQDTDPLINNLEANEFSKMTNSRAVKGIFALNHAVYISEDTSNNWTKDNKVTLSSWITTLAQASFIYQYVKEIQKAKVTKFSTIAFILTILAGAASGLSTLVTSLNLGPVQTLTIGFSVFAVLATSGSAALTGIINKVYKIDETIEAYTKYIEQIDTLYADLEAEYSRSPPLREDATIFINREIKRYTILIGKGPQMDESIYIQALDKYEEFKERVNSGSIV